MVCLDTDFLIELDRKQDKAIAKMIELVDRRELIYTTVVNVAEYYAGAWRSKNKNAVENARRYMKDFSILLMDEEAALAWARLYNELRGSNIGDRDLMIASIALSSKQAILTRNVKHFDRIQGLSVKSW